MMEVEEDERTVTVEPRPREQRTICTLWHQEIGVAVATSVFCCIIFLIILVNYEPKAKKCPPDSNDTKDLYNATLSRQHREFARDQILAANIEALNKQYSLEPHIAGSPRNNQLGDDTIQRFRQYGFDNVQIQRLPVLLMNLTKRSLSRVHPITTGQTLEELDLNEKNVLNQPAWDTALPPTNGYTGSGKATGKLVWANYGRAEDFDAIKDVDLTGTIVVVRYGRIFRGDKVRMARRRGAVGVVICHDPYDVAKGPQFPSGPWANNETVQRGSISMTEGDALTPTWPSEFGGPFIDVADTFNESVMGEGMTLPTIPVQPISFGNAFKLLQGLGDGSHPLPSSWENTGFLQLFSNGIGPGPATATIEVERDLIQYNITNVFATIEGAVEPDRTVLFGAHRDAWTYGAGDPVSGHSIVLEVARALGKLKESGWRPRRTIQVCSWDAEEWSIIGSIEYVETNVELLRQRAVAYLNLDVAVRGHDELTVAGSPLLQHATEMMAAEVVLPGGKPLTSILKKFKAAGSGSDHVGFIQQAGVPVIYSEMDYIPSQYEAVYHSNYDNFDWMSKFGDPGFVYHRVMAQFQVSTLLYLADSNVLPMHVEDYASNIDEWIQIYTSNPKNHFANFNFMLESTKLLRDAAKAHAARREAMRIAADEKPIEVSQLKLREINDMSMGMERVFLGRGKEESGQAWYLHVIFTPSATDFYSAATMPLIGDALATRDKKKADFAIGRIAQFVRRAATFVNSSSVAPPWYSNH